jgi:hypothetical protein
MEINDIQGTVNKSVNISDRNSRAYPGFAFAPGGTKMGRFAHIFSAHRADLTSLIWLARAALEHDPHTGLWRQFSRKLIDRHAIVAEHPLQSGRLCKIHKTITGMRYAAGT